MKYAWQQWEQDMNSMNTTQSERDNLQVHVDNCEQRYQSLDKRLTSLEAKLEKIEEKVDEFRLDFFKIMVGTAGTIVTAIIGAVAVIKWH